MTTKVYRVLSLKASLLLLASKTFSKPYILRKRALLQSVLDWEDLVATRFFVSLLSKAKRQESSISLNNSGSNTDATSRCRHVAAAKYFYFSKKFSKRILIAIGLGAGYCLFGLFLSYILDIASGASIIILATIVYFVSYYFKGNRKIKRELRIK